MKPYHPANFKLTPYSPWRLIALAWVAKFLGVQIHVCGIPFGAKSARSYKLDSYFDAGDQSAQSASLGGSTRTG